MLLAFLRDVHANLEALMAFLEDIEKRKVDEVYCLGDLVGYGPDPEEVLREIEKRSIRSIMGNYDDAVGYSKSSCGCSYSPGRETEVGDISLNWTIEHTSKEVKKFLRSLPKRLSFEVEHVKFLLVHGSPLNELLEYIKPDTPADRFRESVQAVSEDVVVMGCTHLPMVKYASGKLLVNPGSMGRPKDADPRASYMIARVEKGVAQFELVRVAYDVKKTIEKIVSRDLPLELATVLALGQSFNMGRGKVNFSLNL